MVPSTRLLVNYTDIGAQLNLSRQQSAYLLGDVLYMVKQRTHCGSKNSLLKQEESFLKTPYFALQKKKDNKNYNKKKFYR